MCRSRLFSIFFFGFCFIAHIKISEQRKDYLQVITLLWLGVLATCWINETIENFGAHCMTSSIFEVINAFIRHGNHLHSSVLFISDLTIQIFNWLLSYQIQECAVVQNVENLIHVDHEYIKRNSKQSINYRSYLLWILFKRFKWKTQLNDLNEKHLIYCLKFRFWLLPVQL